MTTDADNAKSRATALESAIPALDRLAGLIADTATKQTCAIYNVSPDLAKLEDVLAAGRAEKIESLNNFKADDRLKRLEELAEKYRTEFDTLDFIGQMRFGSGKSLWGDEEFHSNVLAWLLNPKESHRLGDLFLNDFLLRAGLQPAALPADGTATEVSREWSNEVDGRYGYLDLLIVNEPAQVLCAIENKVFSSEHSQQLTRYRTALERVYPDFTRRLVFLTPDGIGPYRREEREHWTSLPYAAVFEILRQLLESNDKAMGEDVRAFLRQYATTLRRNVMPETNISQLARRIYLEHREAIDLIADNRPNWIAETKQWLKEAVARQSEWTLDLEAPTIVRFRSKDWNRYEAMQRGTGWAPGSNALLLFEFKFYDDLPRLSIALSPGDGANNHLREQLFEAVWQHPALFRPRTTSLSDRWTNLHDEADYILDDADYGIGWDDGTTRAKLDEWVANFAANQFPAMNEVIVNCFREYEAEQQG